MIYEKEARINAGLWDLIHERLHKQEVTLRGVWRDAGVKEEDIPADFTDALSMDIVWDALAFAFPTRENYLGNDTRIREAVFRRLCWDTGLPYGFFYYLWQDNLEKAFKCLYDGQCNKVYPEEYDTTNL